MGRSGQAELRLEPSSLLVSHQAGTSKLSTCGFGGPQSALKTSGRVDRRASPRGRDCHLATRGLPSCPLASAPVAFAAPRGVWWADCYRQVCLSSCSVSHPCPCAWLREGEDADLSAAGGGLVQSGCGSVQCPSPCRHPDVAALERGVSYLLGKQLPNGDWPQVRVGPRVGFHLGDLRVTNTTGEWPVLEAGL